MVARADGRSGDAGLIPLLRNQVANLLRIGAELITERRTRADADSAAALHAELRALQRFRRLGEHLVLRVVLAGRYCTGDAGLGTGFDGTFDRAVRWPFRAPAA